MAKEFSFSYNHFEHLDRLPEDDRALVKAAHEACRGSYSPYSGFKVGAAARLASGIIVTGSNQESEVFPAGICAERNLLFHHMATDPEDRIMAMAVTSIPGDRECYPCGICRQVLNDVQKRQGSPIRFIMAGDSSATVIDSVKHLLPFTFEL